jgi:hypothetical protein
MARLKFLLYREMGRMGMEFQVNLPEMKERAKVVTFVPNRKSEKG